MKISIRNSFKREEINHTDFRGKLSGQLKCVSFRLSFYATKQTFLIIGRYHFCLVLSIYHSHFLPASVLILNQLVYNIAQSQSCIPACSSLFFSDFFLLFVYGFFFNIYIFCLLCSDCVQAFDLFFIFFKIYQQQMNVMNIKVIFFFFCWLVGWFSQ